MSLEEAIERELKDAGVEAAMVNPVRRNYDTELSGYIM